MPVDWSGAYVLRLPKPYGALVWIALTSFGTSSAIIDGRRAGSLQIEECSESDLQEARFEGATAPFQTLHHMLETENFWFGLLRGVPFDDIANGLARHQTVGDLQAA